MKFFLLLIAELVLATPFNAQSLQQKPQFGDVQLKDFEPKFYSIDSSADAVYLFNGGYTNFVKNKDLFFDVQFKKFTRIRVLRRNSFSDAGVVEIPLIIYDRYEQELLTFDAKVYNEENGKLVITEFDRSSLTQEKAIKTKHKTLTKFKFAFPGINEGSIIEYTYTLKLPGIYLIPSWHFQTKYPCLWNEYDMVQPEYYTYLLTKRGRLQFETDTIKNGIANFGGIADDGSYYSLSDILLTSTRTVEHLWVAKNVTNLKTEPYLNNLSNYQSSIEFDLYAIKYPSRPLRRIVKNWDDEIYLLLSNESFGESLNNPGGWINDLLKNAGDNKSLSTTERAKQLYFYIRNNFICNNETGIYLSQPLKQTYQKKEGSIADLNLLLTALYIKAGIKAKPTILSTKDNGIPGETYPSVDNYNYLVCLIHIGDEKILLDASNKFLTFGQLKTDCYNGNARVVDIAYPPIFLTSDSLNEFNQTSAFIYNGEKRLNGNITSTVGLAESFEMRKELVKIKEPEWLDFFKKKFQSSVELTGVTIDSLNNPEFPLSIKQDIKFKLEDEDLIYFDPMLSQGIKENPFKSDNRIYPVEMPYRINETYLLNMEIPKGYTVDEMPKSLHLNLNEHDGYFDYSIEKSDDNILMKCSLKLNKANFYPKNYQSLRDFWALIVKKEAEQIVFKKIK